MGDYLKEAYAEINNQTQNKKQENKMIKKLYSVYDKKGNNTLGVYEQVNDLVAIRDFSLLCKKEDSFICKFPEDYCLMTLGEIDQETGIITPYVKTIAEAKEYTE